MVFCLQAPLQPMCYNQCLWQAHWALCLQSLCPTCSVRTLQHLCALRGLGTRRRRRVPKSHLNSTSYKHLLWWPYIGQRKNFYQHQVLSVHSAFHWIAWRDPLVGKVSSAACSVFLAYREIYIRIVQYLLSQWHTCITCYDWTNTYLNVISK